MILGLIIYLAVGCLLVLLGLVLWKKQKISLIHDYHYKHVKKSDIPAYTRLMGIALLLMGASCFAAGIIIFIAPEYSCISLVLGMISGIYVMNRAQKTYNGSWFS